MRPEIRTTMLKKLSGTMSGYSMVKTVCLDVAFSEFFALEASPVEGQSLHQKIKVEKGKGDISGEKGMLSCCKRLFQ